jgi:hypothetical protein
LQDKALARRVTALADQIGTEFDNLLEQYKVDDDTLGLMVTRHGKNVTIRERETSLDGGNKDQLWDLQIDKRVKKAMYLCDEHNISQQSYRALHTQLDGSGPTAYAVDQGRKSMNAQIEEKVPLHSHSGKGDEPRPTVYCSVKKFLGALIDAKR